MDRRQRMGGADAAAQVPESPAQPDVVAKRSIKEKVSFQEYLRDPVEQRIGICLSGGGIRSASYSLGALQALREAELLERAEYLSAVSGGAYIACAHVVTTAGSTGAFPSEEGAPMETTEQLFGNLSAWALNSPEERNLRDNPNYLAPGLIGKAWFAFNMLIGAIWHLLPFIAGAVLLGVLTGFAFHPWLGRAIRNDGPLPDLSVPAWISIGLVILAGLITVVRQFIHARPSTSGRILQSLQTAAILSARWSLAIALFLVGLPTLIWSLSRGRNAAGWVLLIAAGVAALLSVVIFLLRRRRGTLVAVLSLALGPIFLLAPYVGFTYWTTQDGLDWFPPPDESRWPLLLAFVALVVIIVFWFLLDEVTPKMHLFYRDRLGTVFVVYRTPTNGTFKVSEPPWKTPVLLSRVGASAPPGSDAPGHTRLPELIVCAAINLSKDVPPGRNAATFTFDRRFCGSPLTGYVQTEDYEERAGGNVLTLPAMMAISGAALSPSMGRLTRPGLRLLMALFNVRLGVWLPNPVGQEHLPAPLVKAILDEGAEVDPHGPETAAAAGAGDPPIRRPGALYVLREALGLNHLGLRYVYVTDGGHWENLGLVELLRRGCGQIVCIDASGDEPGRFHTLANAIALARADLGVEIEIELSGLKVGSAGFSRSDTALGKIRYPDGTLGVLVYAKTTLTRRMSEDLISFRQIDPKFPRHSTADQLFSEQKYESYRALGHRAGRNAVVGLNELRSELGQDEIPVPVEWAWTGEG